MFLVGDIVTFVNSEVNSEEATMEVSGKIFFLDNSTQPTFYLVEMFSNKKKLARAYRPGRRSERPFFIEPYKDLILNKGLFYFWAREEELCKYDKWYPTKDLICSLELLITQVKNDNQINWNYS